MKCKSVTLVNDWFLLKKGSKYNTYNPEIQHRHSIRLKGYDYSREGMYFITIVVQDRAYLFGMFEKYAGTSERMILNGAGQMVERWYRELENKFPDKRCHEMVIMPNHIHCIVEKVGNGIQFDGDMGPNGDMGTI